MGIPSGARYHGTLIDSDGIHEPKGHSAAPGFSSIASDGMGNTYWRVLVKNTFVPAAGQTSFTLSALPDNDSFFEVKINGVDSTHWFSVAGTTLTYGGPSFALDNQDVIIVRYNS